MIIFLVITNLLTLIYTVLKCKAIQEDVYAHLEAQFMVLAAHIKPLEEHFLGDIYEDND